MSWRERFADSGPPIEGTNGATTTHMRGFDDIRRWFLRTLGIPLYLAIALAILIIGERNFFSAQIYYQTEPMSSIGK